MKWMHMEMPIPMDEHRWMIFYLDDYETTRSAEEFLNATGFEVTLIQDAKNLSTSEEELQSLLWFGRGADPKHDTYATEKGPWITSSTCLGRTHFGLHGSIFRYPRNLFWGFGHTDALFKG